MMPTNLAPGAPFYHHDTEEMWGRSEAATLIAYLDPPVGQTQRIKACQRNNSGAIFETTQRRCFMTRQEAAQAALHEMMMRSKTLGPAMQVECEFLGVYPQ